MILIIFFCKSGRKYEIRERKIPYTTTQTFDNKFLTITGMGTKNLQNSQQLMLSGVEEMGCLLLFIIY